MQDERLEPKVHVEAQPDLPPRSVAKLVYRVSQLAEPACRGWRWIPTAILVGAVPFLISFAAGIPGHQAVSGACLALLCLTSVRKDQTLVGMATMSLAFLSHAVVVIAASRYYPEVAANVLPGARDYWRKQIHWIETGEDPEYELSAWVPSHLTLFGAASATSFTSFGALTFYEGFFQTDLMNFYNARLLARSKSAPLSLAAGWHIWSLMRGVGFLFVTFEMISLAFRVWTRIPNSTWKRRALRWSAGIGFLLADGVIKATSLELIRVQMFFNLA